MTRQPLLLVEHLQRRDESGRCRRAYCRIPLTPWLMLSGPEDVGQFAPLWTLCPACLHHSSRHARFLAAHQAPPQAAPQPAPEGIPTAVTKSPEASHV